MTGVEATRIVELVNSYQARFTDSSQITSQFVNFILSNPNCLSRECRVGQITASCFLVDPSRSRILLTHHKKLGRWLPLGGHADGESDPAQVALKEAREESGIQDLELVVPYPIDLDIHLIPELGEVPAHHHYDFCYLIQAHKDEITVGAESIDLRWVGIDEIPQFSDESRLKRIVERGREILATP